MYSVPQASAQSAVYDTSQQFPSRQPAALQIMQTDVATPYFPSEPTNTATASSLQPHAGSSSTSAVYQQSPAGQRTMLQNYSSGMAPMSGMAQTGSTPDQAMEEQQDYSQTTEMGEAYEQYQTALREVFTNIRSGVLQAASESLLNISEWLLSKVVELGLTADDENLYRDRIKMWQDFNHAWLSLFQKQKEMTESGLALQRGQSLITEEGLRKMGREIVRLCDGIDRHGLVDYQYGVWEEHIIAIIEECLDLYENGDDAGTATASAANPTGADRRGHHSSR
ncbi:elongation factor EF-1 gamma subunit [Hypoxylon texense]